MKHLVHILKHLGHTHKIIVDFTEFGGHEACSDSNQDRVELQWLLLILLVRKRQGYLRPRARFGQILRRTLRLVLVEVRGVIENSGEDVVEREQVLSVGNSLMSGFHRLAEVGANLFYVANDLGATRLEL